MESPNLHNFPSSSGARKSKFGHRCRAEGKKTNTAETRASFLFPKSGLQAFSGDRKPPPGVT
ncbi:hypothetical protein EYF80_033709 [Liparis tanakae]|uniref:Uncharacterized protein n=1 Tax=Liparis tanakae TaxID=230148 RepID=A0A4Z2GQX6_9TELE|nr:hypothetical protein EYF80_033709 [Liparis tanakae]